MAVCRVCGELIEWRMTRRRRWRAYNLDGSVHVATCTAGWVYDAGRFRRKFGRDPQPATGGTGRPGEQAG
jgi:hypothetical protein